MTDLDLTAAKLSAFKEIEDLLIEMRDDRMSIMPAANGLVVHEKDGEPSSTIRITTRMAVGMILDHAAPLIAAQVREQIAQEIKTARDDTGTGSLSDDTPFVRGMRAGMTSGLRIAREGL